MRTFVQADYSPENWIILTNIKAEGDVNIDDATSVEDVMTALNNAQAAMAAIHTLLDDAKAAAHASLNAALTVYPQADYSPDNWAIVSELKAAGDTAIDEASDPTAVEAAQLAAAAEISEVQTVAQTLAAAKHTARDALDAAFAAYIESDYTIDAWEALTGCKAAGDAAIDEAPDLAEVEAAQFAAAAEMDAVQTVAQTLAAAKQTARDALAAAFAAYIESDYTIDAWEALTGCKAAGDAAIDEAPGLAEVEAAQSAAAAEMNAVQTVAQTLAAAKAAAHDELSAAFAASDDSEELHESEVANGAEMVAVTEIDQSEEVPAADSPAIVNESEAAAADMEIDAPTDSPEIPLADSNASTTEEELANSEPALESVAPDTAS